MYIIATMWRSKKLVLALSIAVGVLLLYVFGVGIPVLPKSSQERDLRLASISPKDLFAVIKVVKTTPAKTPLTNTAKLISPAIPQPTTPSVKVSTIAEPNRTVPSSPMTYKFDATTPQLKPTIDKVVDSRSMTVEQRAKFQQAQVHKYCKLYQTKMGNTSKSLARHLLVNDQSKLAFCFVPKAGCSTLKVLFFLTMGAIPEKRFANWTRDPSDENYFQAAINKHAYGAKNKTQRANIIKTYRKIMMYRNPVNRLVSGYFSKVDRLPLIGTKRGTPERNGLRMDMYKLAHPEKFAKWVANGANVSIHVEFQDYVTYWIRTRGITFDEHFLTSNGLCLPCEVKYTYYGKFEDFANESAIFSDMMKGDRSHIYSKIPKSKLERVASESSKYYSLIPEQQKIAIVKILALDLGLYYALFPEERGSHKTIMGLDIDVPIPSI